MLRKLLAGAAIAGLGLVATPAAHAELLCVTVYVQVDDQIVEQLVCTPV